MQLLYPFRERHKITSPYGWRIHPVTKEYSFHRGIDISVPIGTAVLAVADGVIIKVWEEELNGRAIRLLIDDDLMVGYAHLSEPLVKIGDVVEQGDAISLSGNSGRSTAPHLHLSIYRLSRHSINPINLLMSEDET